MTDRELLAQCYDQLRIMFNADVPLVAALKERLAQPEPEPVAWVHPEVLPMEPNTSGMVYAGEGPKHWNRVPLYTVPLQQLEQEPVAWMHEWNGDVQINNLPAECYGEHWTRTPLYTAPPQREWQKLTTAERKVLWNATKKPTEYAELIEAKLKEKNT